jgi:ATP-dependent protease ClpP protease subunit
MSVHYISFSAEIMPTPAEQLIAAVTNLVNQGAQEIHLMVSTPGGSVPYGITVYNTLRALPARIVTYNVGNVDSIGTVIFMAGEERYACANATFMFHGVAKEARQVTRLEEKMLRESLDSIHADNQRIGSIIGSHTNLSDDEVTDLFTEARTDQRCERAANSRWRPDT